MYHKSQAHGSQTFEPHRSPLKSIMSLSWVRALCLSTEEQVRQAAFASAFRAAGFRVVSGYDDTARCGHYRKVIADQVHPRRHKEEGEDYK